MKIKNKKGQISFEALFITLIVLTSAMFISSLYLQTHDVTLATILTRNEITQQLNTLEKPARLQEVMVVTTSVDEEITAEITIITNPTTLKEDDFDMEKLNELGTKIKTVTKFNSIEFIINS